MIYNASVQCMMLESTSARSEYCRQARRIRASFSGSASLRQQALGQLASARNGQTLLAGHTTAQTRVEPVRRESSIQAIERGFAEHAADRLQPFGFTFSDRVDLLNSAEKLGMNRFRANMILALHEHQARQQLPVVKPVSVTSAAPSFLVVLLVEVVLIGAIAWVCM